MPVVVLLILLLIGFPVAAAILTAIFAYLPGSRFTFDIPGQRVFSSLDSFALLAVPLFNIAGEIMNASGITQRIVRFANAMVGHTRAGLAQVNVWSSVIFAGMSGSAVADTSALGRVFIPAMIKEGYRPEEAAAVTAASSVIGPIIPPSTPVIIYALIVGGVSIPGMFVAGIVPGLLLAFALSTYIRMTMGGRVPRQPRATWSERGAAFFAALLPLAMPLFIVGSILLGVVTPTEAAALAVFYALFVGGLIFRTLSLAEIGRVFVRATRDSASVLMIIGAVLAANWLMTFARIPQSVSAFVVENFHEPWMFLLAVNIVLLIAGLFLDGLATMLVLVPVFAPIAVKLGIDPTHFGIVVIFNLLIGLITPPMGMCLFIAGNIARCDQGPLARAILPLFLVEIAVLLLITFVPQTVTFLPRLLGF